jgi:hypothetical protein
MYYIQNTLKFYFILFYFCSWVNKEFVLDCPVSQLSAYPCPYITPDNRRFGICCLLPSEPRGRPLWILRSSGCYESLSCCMLKYDRACRLLNSVIADKYSSLAQPLVAMDLQAAGSRQDAALLGQAII